MAVEARRGCGFRKAGGLYLVGGGLSAPCDRMPYPLDRCPTCGNGVKFTRGHTWLQPDFFSKHEQQSSGPFKGPGTLDVTIDGHKTHHVLSGPCRDDSSCPVCRNRDDFGPHLLLWIGRSHYSPDSFLTEARELGVSRRIAAMPKGLVIGETWVLLAHLDAVPAKADTCARCGLPEAKHVAALQLSHSDFEASKPSPGIFSAFVPRAVELILKESDATPERREKEQKRGVSIVTVPDDDRDHQGSVWDKDEDSQPELPGVAP